MRIVTRLGLLAAFLLGLTSCGINAIPTYEEQAAAWSQVLNQYKRRTYLIPNLVSTVQGAADFERGTLNDVVEARARPRRSRPAPRSWQPICPTRPTTRTNSRII